jgi:hypothetical protein
MATPPLEGPDLTAARHLCHYIGVDGGHPGGNFTTQLLRTIEAADHENRERLLAAFPEYRRAIYISTTQGGDALADTVRISTRLQRGKG